ncbi:MAG: hypothetical protein M3P14_08365 [Chloroflexota bacterium]|nr:hypothetical protein [Chloroflexota bacterium]
MAPAPGATAVRFGWLARLFGAALALYLNLVARTCRITGPITRDQVVLASWHEFNMALFVVTRRGRGDLLHASFSTTGFRGLAITTMLERSGSQVAVFELPPEQNRAAGRALAMSMARLAERGNSLIVTPDGPFGPYRVAKPGALILARASGLPVQPWAMRVRPRIRLTARWDHQLLLLPFCRIRLIEGERLTIKPREPVRGLVTTLQDELNRISGQPA